MRDTELMAKWFEDIAAGLRRRVKALDEVLAIPRLTATQLLEYVDSVSAPLAQRFRALPDDESAAKAVRRATGILQGCFAHIGEIDALLAIRERSAQRASA